MKIEIVEIEIEISRVLMTLIELYNSWLARRQDRMYCILFLFEWSLTVMKVGKLLYVSVVLLNSVAN